MKKITSVIGIVVFVSLLSCKNGKVRETVENKGDAKQVEDFISEDSISNKDSLLLKSDSLRLDSLSKE